MPTPLGVHDVLVAKAFCVLGPQTSVNTFAWRVTSIVGDADLETLLIHVNDRFKTAFTSFMSNRARFHGTSIMRTNLGRATEPIFRLAEQGQGQIVSEPLPLQTAMVLSKRTGAIGRANRGRMYLPFFPKSSLSEEGRWMQAAMNTVEQQVVPLLRGSITFNLAGGNSVTMVAGIWRRPSPDVVQEVNHVIVRVNPGTVRKRGLWGSPNDPGF